ncbi:MAG: hypothetical protein IKE63_03960 [Bacilli bacterium]|nr:hypothetical protein [Bacilli bacterium]
MRIDKDNIKIILILLVICLSIGYAYINSDLNINGTAQVKHANWDIHWANIQVKTGSVSASTPTINNQTTVNYSVVLNLPGDYYEFTVDAVNGGSIDAMIDTIDSKLNGATIVTLPDYLKYTVTYEDGVELQQNQMLAANTTEKYKLRIEYRDDIELNQIPASDQTLSLSFTVTYRQANDNATSPTPGVLPRYDENGGCATINTDSSGGGGNATMSGLTLMMKNATQGEDDPSWFTNTAANQSQAGVYTRKGTSNDKYPIYYYRGAYGSVNNNLIFNNYCWKIVRTTATGGIRIIYNGPASNGQCTTQIGNTTMITTSAVFNTSNNEAKYVKYVYDNNGTPTDSNLKTVLDNWYNTNMSNVDNKIETSIYCNDTSELTTEEKSALNQNTSYTYYCPFKRARNGTPTTLCSKKSDAYKLKVGFLTLDEEALAGRSWGSGMQDYLYNNSSSWLGSPSNFYSSNASVFSVRNANDLNIRNNVNYAVGVRPVVSLVPNTSYSGTGTTTNPFVVS